MQFPDDDDNDSPFIATSPEELQQHMREQAARSQQLSIDVRHQIEDFMEALDEDQLDTLRFMMHMAGHQGASFTLWFEGYISSMMKARFNVCPACHKNHDAEFHKMSGQGDVIPEAVILKEAMELRTTDGTEPDTTPSLSEIMSGEAYEQLGKLAPAEVDGQMELDFTAPPHQGLELAAPTTLAAYEARKDENIETPHGGYMKRSAAMELYRLLPYDDKYFYCQDCGIMYVSLEDRMLKRPDECHGCYAKAGQG